MEKKLCLNTVLGLAVRLIYDQFLEQPFKFVRDCSFFYKMYETSVLWNGKDLFLNYFTSKYHITLHHVMSPHDIRSRDVMSHYPISHYIVSHHITSYHIKLHPIKSLHIISHQFFSSQFRPFIFNNVKLQRIPSLWIMFSLITSYGFLKPLSDSV